MPTGDVKLDVSEAQSSGKLVIEAINICKSFGSRKIVDQFTTRIYAATGLELLARMAQVKRHSSIYLRVFFNHNFGKLRIGAGLRNGYVLNKSEQPKS